MMGLQNSHRAHLHRKQFKKGKKHFSLPSARQYPSVSGQDVCDESVAFYADNQAAMPTKSLLFSQEALGRGGGVATYCGDSLSVSVSVSVSVSLSLSLSQN